jgi:hypothetical protein
MGLDLTVGQLEDGLLNDWAQDAVYDFLIATRAKLGSGQITLSAGVGDYSLATVAPNAMGITEATISSGGSQYGLERVHMDELLDWRRTSQTLDRVRKYAVEGDLLMLYPTPASADTITYYGPMRPTAFTADNNDFTTATYGGIQPQHDTALLAYIRWRAAIYDERRLPHTPDQYRQFYNLELSKARQRMRRMGGRDPVGLRAGYPAGGSPGTRNDTYPPE